MKTFEMKSLIAKLACLLATIMLALAGYTTVAHAQTGTYVIDEYGLLSESDFSSLESQAESISSKSDVGTYLLVVGDIGNSNVRDYAKNYYNSHNLGLGGSKSGILFLIAVNSRDYVTITYGNGVTVYTDYTIEKLEDAVVSYLHEDEFVEGCEEYYTQCESATTYYEDNGTPLDSDNDPDENTSRLLMRLGISLIVALVIMIMVIMVLRGQMKSVAAGHNAENYLEKNGLNLTHSQDTYITTNVTRTAKPKNEGGSSVDSSGFGGSSGGKF